MLRITGDEPAAAHRPPLNLSVVLDRDAERSGKDKRDETEAE
jgi:hypothetical protein